MLIKRVSKQKSFHIQKTYLNLQTLRIVAYELIWTTRTYSLGGQRYTLVVVNNHIDHFDLTSSHFENFSGRCKKIQSEKGYMITKIRSNHSGEFENALLKNFRDEMGQPKIYRSLEPTIKSGSKEEVSFTLRNGKNSVECI